MPTRNALSKLSLSELQDMVQSELGEVPGDETAEELIDLLAPAKKVARKTKASNKDDPSRYVWVYIHNDNARGAPEKVYVSVNTSSVLIKREVWVKIKWFLYNCLKESTVGRFDGKVLTRSRRYNVEMRTLEEGPGSGEVFGA